MDASSPIALASMAVPIPVERGGKASSNLEEVELKAAAMAIAEATAVSSPHRPRKAPLKPFDSLAESAAASHALLILRGQA